MMNWKVCERKWLLPNVKALSQNLSARTEENHEEPQPGFPVSRLRFEPGPSEYEAEILVTRPRRSMFVRDESTVNSLKQVY
jgi:hypothetical protein